MEPEKNKPTKDKTVLKLFLSTLAGLLAWWFVAELFTFADFRQQTRGPAVNRGFYAGVVVFVIVWVILYFVKPKK